MTLTAARYSHVTSGQRAAAPAQFETCRRVIEEELGVEPSLEVSALYDRIKAGAPLTSGQPASPTGAAGIEPARHDRGEAPETGPLYGRTAEAAQLELGAVEG